MIRDTDSKIIRMEPDVQGLRNNTRIKQSQEKATLQPDRIRFKRRSLALIFAYGTIVLTEVFRKLMAAVIF